MSSSAADKIKDQDSAKITDSEIERARAQIGIPQPERVLRHDLKVSTAGISHFAFSYGDDNPLWHDREYGKNTRWRQQIAPPSYLTITGVNETPPFSPEKKKMFRQLFPGLGEYASGQGWEFYKPVRDGDQVFYETTRSGVNVVNSKFSGGRSVHYTTQDLYVDDFGIPVGKSELLMIVAERGGSKKTNKFADISLWQYDDEQIAEIDEIYAAEIVRGADIRYWEDVQEGDVFQPLAKGPLTVTDIIAEHMGRGMGHYGHGPLRYWWKTRQKIGGFYTKNSHGVPDVVQRLHWEHERAQEIGLPLAYDYGDMRVNWLAHTITNWMGDDAWLWKFDTQIRSFNFIGDWHKMEGSVVAVRREGQHCVAEVEVRGTNQRGVTTCLGSGTVILPSKVHGPAVLPAPPEALCERGAGMMSEAGERRAKVN